MRLMCLECSTHLARGCDEFGRRRRRGRGGQLNVVGRLHCGRGHASAVAGQTAVEKKGGGQRERLRSHPTYLSSFLASLVGGKTSAVVLGAGARAAWILAAAGAGW